MATTPSTARLDAAVSLIVERLAPDQIILFGSGARREMIGGATSPVKSLLGRRA